MLFHLFQDNHAGFYMYITTNYQLLLSAHTEARNSEGVVVQQTPAYYFFSFTVKVWDLEYRRMIVKIFILWVRLCFFRGGWCVFDGDAGFIHAKSQRAPWKRQNFHLYSRSNVLKVSSTLWSFLKSHRLNIGKRRCRIWEVLTLKWYCTRYGSVYCG